MSIDVEPREDMERPRSAWRWVAAGVAAAVVVVAVVAAFGAFGSDDKPAAGGTSASPRPTVTVTASTPAASAPAASAKPPADGKVTALSVAPDTGRCIPPSSAWLAKHASLAFEGKVTDIAGKAAVLQVSNWMYADGFGGTDTVRIALPPQTTELTPQFEKGKTYLVAAGSDAKVLGCGYTDVKGPDLQKLYSGAFK